MFARSYLRDGFHRFKASCFLVLFAVATDLYADSVSTGVKSRAVKTPKPTPTKTIQALFKSPLETAWEKGVASITAVSLQDDAVVDTLIKFVHRETAAERLTPALFGAIAKLSEAKQPKAAETLGILLESKDYRMVMAVADATSTVQDRGFLGPIMKLEARQEFPERYGFRRCVVDAVGRYQDKSAIDFLVDRLDKSDGQLKFETVMNLQKVTSQKFGGMAGDWKNWWQENRESFVFASRVEPEQAIAMKVAPRPIPWDESRPSFYGMTIYAKRVVFVIDRSGSMNSTVNGETRLQRAQQELQRAIKALSPSDHFNIVAFDDRMEVFSRRLMPATEANKEDGIRFGYGLEPGGGTACYEPLKMGLEASNDLELILFLSDGEPTAGALVDPPAIVTAISNHNLTQRTTIHTLGIDARDRHEVFLKNLAEKNLGKLLLIR